MNTMKYFLALTIAVTLAACGANKRVETDVMNDYKAKKFVFDTDWDGGKVEPEKLKLESDSIFMIAEEVLNDHAESKNLPEILVGAGDVASKMQQYQKAADYYAKFMEKFPKREDASYVLWLLAYQYEMLPDVNKSIELLQRVRKEYPESPWADMAKTKILDLKAAMENQVGADAAKASLDSMDANNK